jgi:hypothetical protein
MRSVSEFVTKDSGVREKHASGMVRDTAEGKARFDCLVWPDLPYSEQFLTRVAMLLERGAQKYGEFNFAKASSEEELARYKQSAFRHFMQWFCGELDEDHGAAVVFNVSCAENLKTKMRLSEDTDNE